MEQELDRILLAEVGARLAQETPRKDPREVENAMESVIREIVKAHRNGSVDGLLPKLFRTHLQMLDSGPLHYDETTLTPARYGRYMSVKHRLEALIGAALHTLADDPLKLSIDKKVNSFGAILAKAMEAMELSDLCREIWKNVPKPGVVRPRDEDEAVAYTKEISTLRTQLGRIEARYIELKNEGCLDQALQALRRAIHRADKNLSAQSRKASKFLMDQAASVFKMYQSTPADLNHLDTFMSQKEVLHRYRTLFESTGDEDRASQVTGFVEAVDATLAQLGRKAQARKQDEAARTRERQREVEAAHAEFLRIKARYADGELETPADRKKAAKQLRRSLHILKSNGHRVKSREIERFLNATELGAKSTPAPDLESRCRFYRRAFLALLPVTLGLAILSAYLILMEGLLF